MATLFIANTTKATHIFYYTLAEQGRRHQKIPPGGQIRIENIDQGEVDSIVRAHSPYGLRNFKEISRIKEFVGQLYAVDKPVPMDEMMSVFETNDAALADTAQNRQEENAAAISSQVTADMREIGIDVPRLELEVVEDTKGKPNPDVALGIEVTAPGVTPRHHGKPSKRRRG